MVGHERNQAKVIGCCSFKIRRKWHNFSIEPGTRKFVKGNGFLSVAKNLSNKYGSEILDSDTKVKLDH